MIYSNDDPMAVFAMECERTGSYGEFDDREHEICPVCGCVKPDFYYMDEDEECLGCSECVYKTEYLF